MASSSSKSTSSRKTPARKTGASAAAKARAASAPKTASRSAGKTAAKAPAKAPAGKSRPVLTTKPKAAAKAAPAPSPVVVEAAEAVLAGPDLKKRELIDAAVERTGLKRKDAKPIVEAVLAILGESVAEGRELNLQPFGRLKVSRTQDRANGKVFVCRLRRTHGSAGSAEPEAAPEKSSAVKKGADGKKSSSDPLAEAGAKG